VSRVTAGRGDFQSKQSDVRRRFSDFLARLSPSTSHGVSKDRPSIDMNSRRPLRVRVLEVSLPVPFLRPAPARSRSCSAFAVSHRLDGFLRRQSRGFVAPRCRSWGSPRPSGLRSLSGTGPASATPHPSEHFPRQQPSAFPDSCPPVVNRPRTVRLQGFSPLFESAASLGCCHPGVRVAPMGFSSPSPCRHASGSRTSIGPKPPGCRRTRAPRAPWTDSPKGIRPASLLPLAGRLRRSSSGSHFPGAGAERAGRGEACLPPLSSVVDGGLARWGRGPEGPDFVESGSFHSIPSRGRVACGVSCVEDFTPPDLACLS